MTARTRPLRRVAALLAAGLLIAAGADAASAETAVSETTESETTGSDTTTADTATDDTTTEDTTTAATTAGTATTEADAPAPASGGGGTLRYGASNQPTRFDPHRSSNGYDQNWLAPVYDRLIWQTPEVELEPSLATEWEFTDDTTFEMTLRDDVTFTDGEPFNADAVVANIDRAKNVEGSGVHAYLATVESVEAIDDTHVVFHLSRPDATLPMQLATRPGMMLSPAAFENPDLDRAPVGTGPYVLTEYREGDLGVFERNPDYWDTSFSGPDRIEMSYVPDANTRFSALRSGQIDATALGLESIDEAQGIDGLTVDISDTIETYHFQPDRTKSEFGNPLVRRALSHAINRQAIVDGPLYGHANVAVEWVAEGTPYYVEGLGESTTYDPELARELLAEAGLENGFSFTAGVSVQPVFVLLAEVLQSQFAEIGVTMNVVQEPNLADAFFNQNAFDAIVSAYPGRVDPAETAQIYFNSDSFSNPGRQIDPEVEEAWQASLVPGDDRPERLQDLVRAIDVSLPNVPILYPQVGLAYRDGVEGLTWYRSGHIEFRGVGVS